MPLSENERQVLLFNVHVDLIPVEAVDFVETTVPDVVEMLQEIYDAGDAHMRVGDFVAEPDDGAEGDAEAGEAEATEGDNIIRIRDMKTDDDGIVTMLLHHGDARATDPALMEITSGDIRTAGKKPTEVVAYAAHLMISTTKHVSPTGQCRALLERVPNLGRGTVMAFLNRLLRKHCADVQWGYEDKAKKFRRCHPKLVAHAQLSHRLKTDLQDGKLSRIEFVTRKVAAGFEEKNRVLPINQILVHKVVNAPTGNAALDLLQRAKSWGSKNNYEEMQIRFRNVSDRRSASPRFATDLQEAEDAVYSRLESLTGFKTVLGQCPKVPVDEVKTRMAALFSTGGLWK